MFQLLLLMAVSYLASAAVLTAPIAGITPAPLAKRLATTAGYRSTGYSDGTTKWGTVTYNLEDAILATSSDLYRICAAGKSCDFFTCSGGYQVYPSSSTYCGTSSGLTCSYDISYTDLSDFDPKTNYWCDSSTLEGWYIYAVTTGGDDSTTTRQSTTRDSSTTTSASTTQTRTYLTPVGTVDESSSSTPTPTSASNANGSPAPTPQKKSTPIGAIVGGVVGGLALIALILTAIFLILRRNKKKRNAAAATAHQPVPYQPQPPQGTHDAKPPPGNYGMPSPVQQAYYPQGQQQQSPPMGYNPHMSMTSAYGPEKTPGVAVNQSVSPYYASGESGPTSPVPMYERNDGVANELAVGRM